jgi:hypothetical protein
MVLHQGDSTMKKILILLSNPKDSVQLRLGEEIREIKEALKQSKNREQFEIVSESAVRVKDLRRALLEYEPAIVHFSGHGSGSNGLILENDSGETQLVSSEALAKLFKQFQTEVQCVILNACYSEEQAQAIHQHIDCVVGMNQAIGDEAAIKFAVGFYRALGAGEPYNNCFESGRTLIDLNAISEVDKPQIKYRPRSKTLAMSSTNEPNKAMTSPQEKPQSSGQSQSFNNFNISGSHNPFNPINYANEKVSINQSYTQITGQNSEVEAPLNELENMKQEIAKTELLNPIEKATVEVPIKVIETELQKPQPNKTSVDQAIALLKKGLEGVETLDEPVMKVAAILAKVWMPL